MWDRLKHNLLRVWWAQKKPSKKMKENNRFGLCSNIRVTFPLIRLEHYMTTLTQSLGLYISRSKSWGWWAWRAWQCTVWRAIYRFYSFDFNAIPYNSFFVLCFSVYSLTTYVKCKQLILLLSFLIFKSIDLDSNPRSKAT